MSRRKPDPITSDDFPLISLTQGGVHIESEKISQKLERLSLSPSTIASMEQCPAKWLFEKYVKPEVVPEEHDTPGRRGSVFHDIMEQFFTEQPEDRNLERLKEITKEVVQEKYPDFADNPEVLSWLKGAIEGYYRMGGRPQKVSVAEIPKTKKNEEDPDETELGLEIFVKGKLGETTRETLGFIDQVIEDPRHDNNPVVVSDWKGLALETPIPTYAGWTTMGDIKNGDKVIGTDGREVSVVGKSAVHHRDCYEVSFSDGTTIVCDNIHLWQVEINGETRIVDADELFTEHQENNAHIRIANPAPIDYEHKDTISLDPYVFGTRMREGSKLLLNKNIPQLYLRGSIDQRVELLRGLMDHDGYWDSSKNRAVFPTREPDIASGFAELISSLGITPATERGENEYEGYYAVSFTPLGYNPFRDSDNADTVQEFMDSCGQEVRREEACRHVNSVKKVESVPTQCIKVDADDEMFLCGPLFTPTHNTGAKAKHYKKTTKSNDGFNEVRQQLIYTMLLEQRGVDVSSARLVYPVAGTVIDVDVDDEEMRIKIVKSIEDADQAITSSIENNTFEFGPSFLCSWCPLQALCPVAELKTFPKALAAQDQQPTAEELTEAVWVR